MSERRTGEPIDEGDEQSSGLNLKLIYGLIVAALLAAIGVAALVVLPFYQRR
jgi:hypothetical protein